MVKMLEVMGLPKNTSGFRTTHTCELCGFEPKTKNKYREKQDHLVMKHFKEKIDKIFPHCRPYTCPSTECEFTGKDKQALLRHYTGKHGILEQFLREALSERGINYAPGDHPKRKNSTENRRHRSSPSANASGSGGAASLAAQGGISAAGAGALPTISTIPIIGAESLVNNQVLSGLPLGTAAMGAGQVPAQHHPPNRPTNEMLRSELEAMMCSFNPEPVTMTSNGVRVGQHPSPLVVSLPQIPTLNLVSTVNGSTPNSGQISIALPKVPVQTSQGIPVLSTGPTSLPPLSVILPQEPAKLVTTSTTSLQTETSSSASNGGPLPSLISNGRIIKQPTNVQLAKRSPTSLDSMPDLLLPTSVPNGFNGMTFGSGCQGISLPTLPSILTIQQPNKMFAKQAMPSANCHPMPIEALNGPRNSVTSDQDSTPPSSIVMDDPIDMNTDQAIVLENDDIMWSAPHGGPAVVVEVADTVPVAYITSEMPGGVGPATHNMIGTITAAPTDGYSSNTLDNMEYDYLYSNANTHEQVINVRERQLDFNML